MANSLLPELWTKIFEYLTMPADFQSVINTCQEWHNLLKDKKPEMLFGQVLPILLGDHFDNETVSRNRKFSLKSMLTMREVHNEWKKQVDKQLSDHPPRQSDLTSTAELEEFMSTAEPLSLQRGNPFLARSLHAYIRNAEALKVFRRLLETYGRMIRTAHVTLFHGATSPVELSELLQLLPFIEDLGINAIFDSANHRDQLPILFPRMSKLYRLNMDEMFDRAWRSHGREWEQLLFSSLLRSCSESLIYLCGDARLFQLPGINELIPNVKNVFVKGPIYAQEDQNVVSQLQLKLEGIRITSQLVPSEDLLTTLNNFGETLTFLSLHIRKAEAFDPPYLHVFPSLKKLHLHVGANSLEDFPAETRTKFSIIPGLCPNLEELMIMFHRAFRGINLPLATEIISSSFKNLKVLKLSRAEDEYGSRYD